jgi:hypothetical protein
LLIRPNKSCKPTPRFTCVWHEEPAQYSNTWVKALVDSSTPLQHATSGCPVSVDLFDEVGIAGGASGVAGGLLHAFTNKGEKSTILQRSAIVCGFCGSSLTLEDFSTLQKCLVCMPTALAQLVALAHYAIPQLGGCWRLLPIAGKCSARVFTTNRVLTRWKSCLFERAHNFVSCFQSENVSALQLVSIVVFFLASELTF